MFCSKHNESFQEQQGQIARDVAHNAFSPLTPFSHPTSCISFLASAREGRCPDIMARAALSLHLEVGGLPWQFHKRQAHRVLIRSLYADLIRAHTRRGFKPSTGT